MPTPDGSLLVISTAEGRSRVIRIVPPLVIGAAEIDAGCDLLDRGARRFAEERLKGAA